jgi:heme exporter protein B
MDFLKQAVAIAWKDILAELRTKEMLSSMLVFCLLVIVIFNIAIDPGSDYLMEVIPGILWVAITFAGTLGLNRSMIAEQENNCLQGLLLCPIDHSVIYAGKLAGNIIFMLLVEAIILPLAAILYNVDFLPVLGKLVVIIGLSTVGFSAVGTLLAAMSVNTRTREVLLPILLFPIVIPVIIAAVKSIGQILRGETWAVISQWIKLLAVFDVIFLVVCFLTFEYVVGE